jgi:glycosyltransferase involved in cell wall biosynthesis
LYRGLNIAVVIPAHNEERLIRQTLETLPGFVDQAIVVDDHSSDGTAAVVEACARPGLRLLRRSSNGGVGQAIVDGYRLAIDGTADVAVVMGGDAQMDPTEMPALLDPITDGDADFVKGDRLSHSDLLARMPLHRVIGNHALTRLTEWVIDAPVRDSQCGYTAIRVTLARALALGKVYKRYGFPNDLLGLVVGHGARHVDVPITPIYGDERSGIRLPGAAFSYSFVLGRLWWRRATRARGAAACGS